MYPNQIHPTKVIYNARVDELIQSCICLQSANTTAVTFCDLLVFVYNEWAVQDGINYSIYLSFLTNFYITITLFRKPIFISK